MSVETKRSFCRFCHASCAMVVEVEDDRIVSVRGDKEDHLFHGYTCVKGRQLPDMHNLPERMITSKIRQPDGSFKDIATAEALKLAGERMKKMVEENGPHSIAVYCGTKHAVYGPPGASHGAKRQWCSGCAKLHGARR